MLVLQVLYADEDGGMAVTYQDGPILLNDFDVIEERCVFTLKPKRKRATAKR